eukprot:NODE_4687_length_774_cov_10.525517_g3897_i0.p2 GENE.NODE_4687_length_774_cov_10.525517_g3897_i0~~NODE_4687_length_774_cov_10.525517_g3897_i0.p2  ORF type:complete len:79 (+),score=1.93 NODE_4687_length_774_cov_10.525517_g3897_i0:329-565(+)
MGPPQGLEGPGVAPSRMKSESCEKPPGNPPPQGPPGASLLEGPGGLPPKPDMKSESCTSSEPVTPGPSRTPWPWRALG